MGFPVGCSELLLPRILLRIIFLLGYVRRLIFWVFNAIGLGDLLDSDVPWPENPTQSHSHGHIQYNQNYHQLEQLQVLSVSTKNIQEALPVVRYEELVKAGQHIGDSCAVCLSEFEVSEEVRGLRNCRHIFHSSCLDRWTEHDQRTCPLCRTPLIANVTQQDASTGNEAWASAEGIIAESYYYDDFYSFFTFPTSSSLIPLPPPPQSPALLLQRQLFSSS